MLIDDKECCLFLSHFFVTAADYQFWKVPATPRARSVRAKSLFIVLWNVRMIACFEDFVCVPCCRNDNDVTTYKGPPKFNSFRRYFNQIYWDKLLNKLIITVEKKSLIGSRNFSTNCNTARQKVFRNLILVS